MGSVVQLSAYRRPRPEPAAAQPTPPAAPVEAEIVILPVVRIVRGEPAPVEVAQG
ncbi:MAG: hypothetical protein K0R27_1977 [Xanthobacteraceae bacterium]|jgi:hypothetical protein|nr:hypothetical protein [Xanthobacteraceae bacterium]